MSTTSTSSRRPELGGIVVDWDETCKANHLPWWKTWKSIAAAHGHDLRPDEWAPIIAANLDPGEIVGITEASDKVVWHGIREHALREVRQAPWRPGARELLTEAATTGRPRGLLSDANNAWFEITASPQDRALFTHTQLAGEHPADMRKHSGAPLRALLREMFVSDGVRPNQVLFIDDLESHLFVARRMGVAVLHVPAEPFEYTRSTSLPHRASLEGFTLAEAQDLIEQQAFELAR